MPTYRNNGIENVVTYSTHTPGVERPLSGKAGHIRPGESFIGDDLGSILRLTQSLPHAGAGQYVYENAVTLILGAEPPGSGSEPVPPIPTSPGNFWIVRGDEELRRFDFHSRTLAPDWVYLPQTPSVFRFDKYANDPTLWRVDILLLRVHILRVNNWTEDENRSQIAYAFSGGTALFNGNAYPRQAYLTMSFNVLEEITVEGGYLKFKTIIPGVNHVSQMTRQSHPQFVHKWDIVTARRQEDGSYKTFHVNTPHGAMYWFLASKEGYGYIPLEVVRRV